MNAKKDKAIPALLASSTLAEAAAKTGITERTLYNWLQDEAFQGEYRRARWQAAGLAIAKLQQMSAQAAAALQDVFSNKEAPANARVSAARTVLELSIKAVELENLESRLTALEQQTGGKRNGY